MIKPAGIETKQVRANPTIVIMAAINITIPNASIIKLNTVTASMTTRLLLVKWSDWKDLNPRHVG